MFNVFRVIVDRVKAVFATAAALELEADLLAREAKRRAAPGRRAARRAGRAARARPDRRGRR